MLFGSNNSTAIGAQVPETASQVVGSRSSRAAFTGLFIFTLVLYVRPNELFPGALGWLPLAKIVALTTLAIYIGSKLGAGERLTIWPIEMKMLAVIIVLGVAFLPIAYSKDRAVEILTDSFLKVATIFVLMINLIDARARLRSMMKLVVLCGTFIALATIATRFTGDLGEQLTESGTRVEGIVGGIFGNPNDLATAFDLLLPLALALALTSRGLKRIIYLIASAIITFGVIITFSRGGFLGLVAMGGVLLWKIGRRNRLATVLVTLLAAGVFISVLPSGYSDRILTIFQTDKDTTNSAQERTELLKRAFEVAGNNLVIGVGIGNYPFYSLRQRMAHNSYLEIWAELGLLGLIAYLTMLFAPMRSLRRIARDVARKDAPADREIYLLTAGVQAAMVAYLVCSFFGSVQYQWFVYYIIAYAVALRRLHAAEGATIEDCVPVESSAAGYLWAGRDRGELKVAPKVTIGIERATGVMWKSR
jgi:O-antigen ligase